MLNIGIIGTGSAAHIHAKALKEIENVRLHSVASRNLDNARFFANQYAVTSQQSLKAKIKPFDSVVEMVNDPELDAVIIATPDKLHEKHILLVLEAGKSILAEKPLCTSLTSSQKIMDAFKQAKVTFVVGYHLRWHDGLRRIAEKIHSRELGEIFHMELNWSVNFMNRTKWRTEKESSKWLSLSGIGTHLIDLMRWILVPVCGEITEIKSMIDNSKLQSEFDESADILLRFRSGTIAHIYCSSYFNAPFNLNINASHGTIIGNDLVGAQENRKIVVNGELISIQPINPYLAQLKHFVSLVREKNHSDTSIKESIKNVEHLISIF